MRVLLSLLMICLVLVCSCKRHSPAHPNVLFITIDTIRADHCSLYGYSRPTTPQMEQLAKTGAYFQIAYAPMATTAPSHSTMFTSEYPISHGVFLNGHHLISERQTMAEFFRSAGYETAAFVSSFVLNSKFGLSQGFDTYDDHFNAKTSSIPRKDYVGNDVEGGFDRRANETTKLALAWLANHRRSNKPFFVWIHYFDPHYPYIAPEPYGSLFQGKASKRSPLQKQIADYDAEIRFVDDQLPRLAKFLSDSQLDKDTIIAIAGDHGENLMQHGHPNHGQTIYEEDVRVPLIFIWPDRIPANKIIRGPVEMLDLLPTILDLAGVNVAKKFQGASLAPYLFGKKATDPSRRIFVQRRPYKQYPGEMFGLREGNFYYIEALQQNKIELYDLKNDPGERRNISAQNSEKVKQLSATIRSWYQKFHKVEIEQHITEEDQEGMKALGYTQ